MTSRPLRQGDEDSLCGPYSVVNAVHHLWPGKLSADEISALFKVITHLLDRWPAILWDGTHYGDMITMLTGAQCFLTNIDLRFVWHRPFKQKSINHIEVFETNLRHELDCPGTAAIVMLRRPSDHWLVADRFTNHHMCVVDSGGTKPMHLAHCGLRVGRTSNMAHKFVFDYPYTFVLRREA